MAPRLEDSPKFQKIKRTNRGLAIFAAVGIGAMVVAGTLDNHSTHAPDSLIATLYKDTGSPKGNTGPTATASEDGGTIATVPEDDKDNDDDDEGSTCEDEVERREGQYHPAKAQEMANLMGLRDLVSATENVNAHVYRFVLLTNDEKEISPPYELVCIQTDENAISYFKETPPIGLAR